MMGMFAPQAGLKAAQLVKQQQMMQPPEPSFFGEGGVGRNIAGFIGDALLQNVGRAPIFAPVMQARQQAMHEARLAEQKRQQDMQDWQAKEQWKIDNPGPPDDAFSRALIEGGIQPGTEQWGTLHKQRAENMANPVQMVQLPNGQYIPMRPNTIAPGGAPMQRPTPPEAAIKDLQKNPGTAHFFDEVFGPGASQKYLTPAPSYKAPVQQGGPTQPASGNF